MPDHSPAPDVEPPALPSAFVGLIDDAAIFPPGDAPLGDAITAHTGRQGEWWSPIVRSLVVRDTDLGSVPTGLDLSVVLSTGAGAVVGTLALAKRRGHRVVSIETALRDADDPAANARRVIAAVDAARDEGVLDDDTLVHIEIPVDGDQLTRSWLGAADEVAAAELRLKFRTGGLHPSAFPEPSRLAAQIDAALDRETPFKATAGLHHAVRHQDSETGWWHHGFLNLLLATAAAWDGADPRTVAAKVGESDARAVADDVRRLGDDLTRARRWFTSFGSCSVDEPLDDLVALNLVGAR